ncbi:dihydrodipicolinate synthase family protein [Paenibacillus sp. GCM10027626]|uniref:dihydrodipicolinate synthase family protein n=1 Tax=Paenibacillus sp. GCM10027626 TaxID=3273411 RepID=UPI003634CAF2
MVNIQPLHGVIVPIIIPLDQQGAVDHKSFKQVIKHLVSRQIHGVILHTECKDAAKLASSELEELILTAGIALGEASFIVGIAPETTRTVVQHIKSLKALGADAVLVAPPYSPFENCNSFIRYFLTLAEAELPIILHNRPQRNGEALELSALQPIMELDHMIGVVEGTGSIRRLFQLSRGLAKPVLSSRDDLFFSSLCCGTSGGLVTSAHADSELFVHTYELYRSGKIDEAKQLFDQLLPLIQFIHSESSLAPLKWLLAERGLISSGLPVSSSMPV